MLSMAWVGADDEYAARQGQKLSGEDTGDKGRDDSAIAGLQGGKETADLDERSRRVLT
jgi:hypothetical protein